MQPPVAARAMPRLVKVYSLPMHPRLLLTASMNRPGHYPRYSSLFLSPRKTQPETLSTIIRIQQSPVTLHTPGTSLRPGYRETYFKENNT